LLDHSRDLDVASCFGLGLRYDDLYDPYNDLDIKEALARLPREVVDARNQRLKRAMDLSMKHQYLPDDVKVKIRVLGYPMCKQFRNEKSSISFMLVNFVNSCSLLDIVCQVGSFGSLCALFVRAVLIWFFFFIWALLSCL
jgi:hypothetical protein